jgi:very-short-patch-repair endonuclease
MWRSPGLGGELVVSSFSASQLAALHSESRGVLALQRYLDYAERGISALAIDLTDSGGDAESPLEESVLSVLRNRGYDVVTQVGTAGYRIDLGIRHPTEVGRFALGVECDGAAYHSSKVARDRDRLRQEVLEHLGWRLYRVVSADELLTQVARIFGFARTGARIRAVLEESIENLVYIGAAVRGSDGLYRPSGAA